MSKSLWRCKVCGAIFNTFEEAEFHLEHTDSIHARWLYEKGTWECLEEIKPENLADYGYKYSYYKYPYYGVPKDFKIQVTQNIWSTEDKTRFWDTVSKKEYSGDELIKFLEAENRTEELKKFLEWKIKEHLSNIAKLTGVNVREEDLKRMTKEELLALMFKEYFTHEDKRERLGIYALSLIHI